MSLDPHPLELPGGLVNRAGDVCRNVFLRELTGADEEALFSLQLSGSARVTQFLARVIERVEAWDAPTTETWVDDMHLGDRDYLLLRLRQRTLGDAVHQVMRCPSCSARVDVDFKISELPVRRLPDRGTPWRLVLDDGTALTLRLPTGADQQAIEHLALGNPAEANTRLFARLVLAVNNGPAPTEAEVRAWPMQRRNALSAWLADHAPGPDLFLDLVCPECRGDLSYTFDLNAFFAEHQSGWAQLLEEVHVIAHHYHWSEADILRLSASRRGRYLHLIARDAAVRRGAEVQ